MLSYCALYDGITIPTIFQNSPQKSSGKGSLLLPCPKMPIDIFLFSLKSEFKKSEEKGKKRRKPEKISGFSVGIFFVNSSWRRHPKYSPLANISHLAVGRQATAALRRRCEPGAVQGYGARFKERVAPPYAQKRASPVGCGKEEISQDRCHPNIRRWRISSALTSVSELPPSAAKM